VKKLNTKAQKRRGENENNMKMSFASRLFPIFLCASASLRWKLFRNYFTASNALGYYRAEVEGETLDPGWSLEDDCEKEIQTT